jgi:hypothetical protein
MLQFWLRHVNLKKHRLLTTWFSARSSNPLTFSIILLTTCWHPYVFHFPHCCWPMSNPLPSGPQHPFLIHLIKMFCLTEWVSRSDVSHHIFRANLPISTWLREIMVLASEKEQSTYRCHFLPNITLPIF